MRQKHVQHLHCFTVCPPPPPPPFHHACSSVSEAFVWRCFDRQGLCVWAVLAGWPACLVQSWWRAKCSLWVGCAFHSAQPPWTASRQTAAGGTPLPPSFPPSIRSTQTAHTQGHTHTHCWSVFLHPSPFNSCFLPFSFNLIFFTVLNST